MNSDAAAQGTATPPALGALRLLVHTHDVSVSDACVAELRGAGWEVHSVVATTLAAFKGALRSTSFDIVISDYRFPGWTGLDALNALQGIRADVPFVLVSGGLGDEIVVDCLKHGVSDCILKSNLWRLPHAVERIQTETAQRAASALAFDAVSRSEARFRRIVDTSSEGIWTIDAAGHTTYVNRRMCELLGHSAHEMAGHVLGEYLHAESKAAGDGMFDDHGQIVAGEHEVRFSTKDGSDFWARMAVNAIVGEDGVAVGGLAMVTDLTARKQLEQRFLQAQRMESVGRLAGGVAHDFNNLLSVIIGWTEMAMSELPAGHAARSSLEEVLSAGQGAAKLARKLLAFSRQQVVAPSVFNPNDLVAEVDEMVHRLIGEDIEFEVRTDPALGAVCMDRAQLEQVLLNLVVNARDAMPDGGRLTIETANAPAGAASAAASARGDGDAISGQYVMIRVSDSGAGMTDDVKSHLFEPFFTTKAREKGTGLGLSTCHGIVTQAGGHIVVESATGVGTTLKLFLPACPDTAVYAARHGVKPASARGVETILLVEDESAVRRVTASMLEARGFRVLSTASGEDALRLIADIDTPLHLLLTDVVLAGGMSGGVLAERVRAVRPDLRVLFVSGYADDVSALHDIRLQKAAFLQKPFTGDALGQKVREVLDEEHGSRTNSGA